ncbi:CaiB/BaiF CoA transferase family protein, partial [Rhizobiaceae sp. 2RAB30]
MSSRPSPLSGMKIVDLSQIMAGPYCTMVLADLGAEVIKVEKPVTGDDAREMGPYVNGESTCFAHINRNKDGISLNLKDPQAREILYDMIRWADVVVENYRVGVTKSLGVDYETLSKINPRLIYCSVSGYGQTGPYSGKGGFDLVAQGMTGIMSMTGEPSGRPIKTGIAIYDVGAGLTATYSIIAAYVHQQKTGEGQHIDISLMDVGVSALGHMALTHLSGNGVPTRRGNRLPMVYPSDAFKCRDGWVMIIAGNNRQFENLCGAFALEGVPQDRRFASNPERLA